MKKILWIFVFLLVLGQATYAENTLSQNDQNFYNKIQTSFGARFESAVDTALTKYEANMDAMWLDMVEKQAKNKAVIEKVETMTTEILVKYPQDTALPANVNQRYFVLSYLKFELMMLDFSEKITESDAQLRDRLTSVQYEVTQNGATEIPFANTYFDNFEAGIYVDIVDGEVLFSSTDKFKTNTGWPAFAKPISQSVVKELEDLRYNMVRTEVKWASSDSHLGHIFTDGPKELGGLRYCINSASLRFISVDEMQAEWYEEYLYLFE